MDRNTLLFIFLSLTIWYVYLAFFPPEVPEDALVDRPVVQDVVPAPAQDVVAAEIPAPSAADDFRPSPARLVRLRLCGAEGEVSTTDGGLRAVQMDDITAKYEAEPLYSVLWLGSDWRPYGGEPGPAELVGRNARALVAGVGDLSRTLPVEVLDQDGGLVTRTVTSEGIEITRALHVRDADPCVLDVEVTWRNTTGNPYNGGLWFAIHDELPASAGGYDSVRRPWARTGSYVDWRDDLTKLEQSEVLEGEVSWFGLADTYFAFLFAPVGDAQQARAVFGPGPVAEGRGQGVHWAKADVLDPGSSYTARFVGYLGKKDSDIIGLIDPPMDDVVQLGWLSFFAWPLLWLLKFCYGLTGQWGLAIILLTFLVKLAFFPLTQMSFKSSQAMQLIQPELTKIREDYKDDPQELNRRTIQLFQDKGVNPLGGCLPMLLQMPVWFALYSVLLSSADLYHSRFLYLRDLTAIDPYFLLPAVVMVVMVVQQRMMPMGNMDPAQARVMRLMPVIFGVFFFTLPAGLVLYILVNMMLSIAQQWYIKRTYRLPTAAAPAGA